MIAAVVIASAFAMREAARRRGDAIDFGAALGLAAGCLGLLLFTALAVGLPGLRSGDRLTYPWWVIPVLLLTGLTLALALTGGGKPDWRPARPILSWRLLAPLALLLWPAAFDLLLCFTPRFEADALWYHLTLPYAWLRYGMLPMADIARPIENLAPSGYPLLIETFYAIPLTHTLPFAAKVLHLTFGLGVVGVMYFYLRPKLAPAAALTMAAAFFLFDSVNETATWANTDLGRAFFLVGAATALARHVESQKRTDLLAAGALAGFALSTHYLCIIFGLLLLTLAFVCASVRRNIDWRRVGKDLAAFWGIALLIFAPWLGKNMVHFGNPLYGLMGSNLRWPPPGVLGSFYLGNAVFVLFPGVAIWMIVRQGSRADERLLALYLLFYLALGPFEMPPILRFFFPVHAIGLILTGLALAPVFERRKWLEIVLPAGLLASIVLNTTLQWRSHMYEDAVRFLTRGEPSISSIQWRRNMQPVSTRPKKGRPGP